MKKAKTSNWKLMLRLTKMVKPVYGTMLMSMLGGVVGNLSILVTLGAGTAFLCSIAGQNMGLGKWQWMIVMLVSACLRGPCRYLEQYKGHDVAYTLLAYMRVDMYNKIRELSPARLTEKRNGDLLSTAIGDVECIEAFFAHTMPPIMIAVFDVLATVIFASAIHVPIGLGLIPFYLIIGILIPILSTKVGRKSGRSYRAGLGSLKSFLIESLHGIKETLVFGRGQDRLTELEKRGKELNRYQHWLVSQKNVVTSLPDFITMLVRVLLMGVCSALMLRGRLTVGQVAVLVVVIGQSFTPVSSLSGVSGSLIQTFAAAERFFGIMDETPQVADGPEAGELTEEAPDVDYENVAFTYPETSVPVLRGVSMELPKGSHVALWGESGCGKSTLLRLLLRFWDPDSGKVCMDKTPLPELKLAQVRGRVSMLAQDTWLSGDSVAENIRLAKKDATREEIEEAARRACIYDTIQSLPQGFDTPAGELGDRLSGGERQRIGIARVLLRKSPVMVFDEPTSSLDTLNEKGILKTLNEECADVTVITVSHRLSTIAGAERVFHIVDGEIDDKAII